MHIPDAYLSPATEVVLAAVMAPIGWLAIRNTRATLTSRQAPLLSIGAAFCFAVQMFNVPAPGGTSAHALGCVLLAILLGPWAALLAIGLCLTVQALFFGDGGLLSLGANTLTMGFVAPFVGFGVYRLIAARGEGFRRVVAAGVGGYCGIVAASFVAGLILGLQPLLAHDASGHALYFPFGLNVSLPAMVSAHLLVAGPVEALVTAGALSYLMRSFPEYSNPAQPARMGARLRLGLSLAGVLLLTPLGLLASGDAWGEWELDEIRKMVGYEPAGLAARAQAIHPLLPDYGFGGAGGSLWQIAGYLASAILGSLVLAVTIRILFHPKPNRFIGVKARRAPQAMPEWMLSPNPALPETSLKSPKAWLERSAANLREMIAKSVAIEELARQKGLLQDMPILMKLLPGLALLAVIAMVREPIALAEVLAFAIACGLASKVRPRHLLGTVGGSVVFFGLPIAIPQSLAKVTAGPTAFTLGSLAFSETGLHSALVMLLRLSAGLTVTYLLLRTTKSAELRRVLRKSGLPAPFVQWIGLSYRYLFVLTETLAEMIEARKSRQPGHATAKAVREYAATGSAVLFGKSMGLSEELYMAMRSRSIDHPELEPDLPRNSFSEAVPSASAVALMKKCP